MFIELIIKSKLTVEQYFEDTSRERFVPVLAVENLTNMDDLKCESHNKEEKFGGTMEVVKNGFENEIKEWNDEKKEHKQKLTLKQRKFFQQPNDKMTTPKEGLDTISTLLCEFFDKIHIAMTQSQKILGYSSINRQLSDGQQNANAMQEKLEYDTKNKQQTTDDIQAPNSDERALQLMNRFHDKIKKLVQQNMALSKASVSINVVDIKETFSGDGNIARAKGLADGVEETCMNIIRSTATIRQSLLLGQAILQLKPSNLNDRSKQLRNDFDDGIIQIFKNALEMSKVIAEYCGYFLEFKERVDDCNHKGSTEHEENDNIHKYCYSFTESMNKQLNQVREEQACTEAIGEAKENTLNRGLKPIEMASISAATERDNDMITIKMSNKDITDDTAVSRVFEELNNKIGNTLSNDKWDQRFLLVNDDLELEKLEEIQLRLAEIEDGVIPLLLQVMCMCSFTLSPLFLLIF